MVISDLLWNASLEELKLGFREDKEAYNCLLCEERVEKGMVYPHDGNFYEAERYMRIHIENSHKSVFEYLIGLDKKLTGLTDHQNNLIRLFYQGKSDTEIQKELDIGSTSTIRHHRFALKEKERQAKTFLAMMELLKEKDQHDPAFVPVHKTARMVDERYNITEEEQKKIIRKYFPEGPENQLTKFPVKEKQKLVVLRQNGVKFMHESGGNSNKQLQEDWKQYGKDAFTFEVLDTLKKKDEAYFNEKEALEKLEERWLNRLLPYDDRGNN